MAILIRHCVDRGCAIAGQADGERTDRRRSGKASATNLGLGLPPVREAESTEGSSEDAIAAARLDGVLLAARTAAHLINNDLTTTVGLDQIAERRIRRGEPVDPHLLEDAVVCALRAGRHLKELQEITRLEIDRGAGDVLPILDLKRSRGRIL